MRRMGARSIVLAACVLAAAGAPPSLLACNQLLENQYAEPGKAAPSRDAGGPDGGVSLPAPELPRIAAGAEHTCAIKADGSLVCWGIADTRAPTTAEPGPYVEVRASSRATCARRDTGAVKCWFVELEQSYAPVQGRGFTQIAMRYQLDCALAADGQLRCLDHTNNGVNPFVNSLSQIALGEAGACGVYTNGDLDCGPIQLPSFTESIRQMSVGGTHACFLGASGAATCVLVDGSDRGQASAPEGRFLQISAGWQHTCAIDQDRQLVCWGTNASAQSPQSEVDTFVQVAAGTNHTCAIRADGKVRCWSSRADLTAAVPPTTGGF